MRKPIRLFSHDKQGVIPRMSWSPHNLYNLISRSTVQSNVNQISFKQVSLTMFQQRWRSKRFLRGYHGDWIGERRFRRWYLPTSVPRLGMQGQSASSSTERGMTEQERLPVITLFLRDVERRLDTVVHRCCFARSAREARALIVQGKVKLNGAQTTVAGTLLNPGDLLSVEPSAVPMLSKDLARKADEQKATEFALNTRQSTKTESAEVEGATTTSLADQSTKENTDVHNGGTELPSLDTTDSNESIETSPKPLTVDGKGKGNTKEKRDKDLLLPGVLPFNLPPFAAPFLFVPPYLEVSFTTCSAVYIRHPTITPAGAGQKQQVLYNTDIPSPYPATGDMYSLAWEMYARDAPRIRSDVRRLRLEARIGRKGLQTARAKDQWRKVLAIRRKRDREDDVSLKGMAAKRQRKPTQFIVGRNGGPVQQRISV